ncbi:pentatricopeptide repeat-containing protein At5g56310-like [Tasmannia lanceolata]|uniref:pentatricopeptide repeat-containing protein At5g56310-like n=1 Tax=Tasmannia lanceolata TaxID=3420 RepID=UPI0040639DD8
MAGSQTWSRAQEEHIVGLVRRCVDTRQLKQIHSHLIVSAQSQNNFLIAKLVRTFAALGSLKHARSLTDNVNHPNAFLWTAIIRAYSQQQSPCCTEALVLYAQMHRQYCLIKIHDDDDDTKKISSPNSPLAFTLSSVLKACASLLASNQGLQIHTHVLKYGFNSETCVQTALLNVYAMCGRMAEARRIFDRIPFSDRDVQAWNTMIAGYANYGGDMRLAFCLFQQMRERNLFTWVEMINGYANSGQMDSARRLLDEEGVLLLLRRDRRNKNAIIIYTALIMGYANCGDISAARIVFDEIPESERDVASWNAIITAYSRTGLFDEVIHLFRLMTERGGQVQPNSTTMAIVVSTCAQLGSSRLTQWVIDYLESRCWELANGRHIVTALIDMYAKCGDLNKAYEVFQRCEDKDVVCYSSMIAGFAIHGRGVEALEVFSQLKKEGLEPDGICFISVLIACSHAGLVMEGYHHFESMRNDYSIPPTADHYMCMVDLLGRAGLIDEAYKIITKVMPPVQPHAGIWGSLLSACRLHSNVELGEEAGRHLLDLEPENSGNYVLLSNMYSKARRWNDVAKVRALMRARGMRKPPGCSWIEVDSRTHKFLTGDVWDCRLEKMIQVLGWDLMSQVYPDSIDHEYVNI